MFRRALGRSNWTVRVVELNSHPLTANPRRSKTWPGLAVF